MGSKERIDTKGIAINRDTIPNSRINVSEITTVRYQ